MFERMKSLIRKAGRNILGTADLFEALEVDAPISQKMQSSIDLWSAMHENRAPWLNEDTHSLNLAATISSELARLVTIEMQSSITGSARATFLDQYYQRIIKQVRNLTEFACARGDVVLKPYIDGEGIAINWVKPGDHYSLAYDSNGNSIGELFLDWHVTNDKIYVRGEIQQLNGSTLEITNKVVVKMVEQEAYRPSSLDAVNKWKNIAPSAKITGVKRPLWGYFKMPFSNITDPSSPLGVSAYARCVELIKQADLQYSRLLWEMESGERALYVDKTAFDKGRHGDAVLPHKRLYKALKAPPMQNASAHGGHLFEDWTPTLREQNIINALNEILSKIEDAAGLARGTLADEPSIEGRTATEIKMLQQRTFVTVTDTQKALENALKDLVYAMDVWATVGGLAPSGHYEATFDFDDSVITDRDADFERIRFMASSGWIAPEFAIGWQYNMPTDTEEDLAAIRAKFMPDLAEVGNE